MRGIFKIFLWKTVCGNLPVEVHMQLVQAIFQLIEQFRLIEQPSVGEPSKLVQPSVGKGA